MRRRLVSLSHLPENQTKQKEISKMYRHSINQHHTENRMQIWKIVEEKSQCESKFQKSKIKNQKIKKSQREWKKDLWQRIGFHRQESWEGTIWQSRSSACRSALFLQCPPFLSLSLSLFWECGRFWKGIEFAVCVLFVCVCCRGEKEDQDLIGTVSLVWWGLCDERNGRTRLFGSHRGKQSNPRGVRSVKCEK